MPYVGEHSAPQIDPSKFDKFRRVHETLAPDGIDFIYGFKDGGSEIQSVRADAEIWTVEAFRKWLGDHELTDQYLKPAIDEEVEAGYKYKDKDNNKQSTSSKAREQVQDVSDPQKQQHATETKNQLMSLNGVE